MNQQPVGDLVVYHPFVHVQKITTKTFMPSSFNLFVTWMEEKKKEFESMPDLN